MFNPFAFLGCLMRGHRYVDVRDARSRWQCKRCRVSSRKLVWK